MTNSWQYDLKPDDKGWTVYSTKTGEPVRLNGAPQVGLTRRRGGGGADPRHLPTWA